MRAQLFDGSSWRTSQIVFRRPIFFLVFLAVVLFPADGAAGRRDKTTQQGAEGASAEDFMVVDCLLPGKVRRLGRRQTFVTPRRPVRTTAIDCRIRGGEYTESDRANYSTALNIWLAEAKGGNAEAQYYVGQIYEKGLGLAPDHQTAAHWYRQAAEQGYSSAQIGLGYLYENGLGVEQDPVAALNWYRRASGLPEELIVLEGSDYEELLKLQDDLSKKSEEVDQLQQQLRNLRRELEKEREKENLDSGQENEMRTRAGQLQVQLETGRVAMSQYRSQITDLEARLEAAKAERASALRPLSNELTSDLDFGPYHALVIGNSNYRSLQVLDQAIDHADKIADVMESRYGFTVQRLYDASRYDILSTLNELRKSLTEKHNLLVYYVGHSTKDRETQRTWWQPIDAEPESSANWIRTRELSSLLDLIPAKHLLVVADASYAGVLTRSSVPRLPQGMTDPKRRQYIQEMLGKRSRLVMAGGGSAAKPSLFSETLLEVLMREDQVAEASAVYLEVCERIVEKTQGIGIPQVPEFAPLRWVRADGGADFFFVPRTRGSVAGP